MSAYLADFAPWPNQNGIVGKVYCDTAADLPTTTQFSDYGTLTVSTKAYIISTGQVYMLNGSGAWVLQPSENNIQLDLTGYYTSAQVDSAIASALSGYYTSAQVDSAIASSLTNYYTSAQVDSAITANNIGTAGAANDDLNNFTDVGHKYWSTSNASSLANRPLGTQQSGALSAQNFPIGIDPQSPRVLQMVIYNVNTGSAQNRIFLRILSSSGWSGWFESTMAPLV